MTADFALFAPSQSNLLNYDFTDSAQTAIEESSTQSLNGNANWIDLSVEVRKVDDGIHQYLPQCAISDPLILDVDQLNSSSSTSSNTQDGLQQHGSRISAAQLNAAECHMQQLLPVTAVQTVTSSLSSAEFSSTTAAPPAAPKNRPASATEERRFTCQLCGKAFKRHDHLNGHLITHREKKPFECTFQGCGKSYCDARSLKRHQENHHSNSSKTDSSPSGSPDSQKTPNSPRNDSRKKSKAKSDPNEGLTTQQLELIQEIMRQTQEQHRLQQEEQQRQQQQQQKQPKSKKNKSRAAAAGEAASSSSTDGNNRPVECTVCQRKFKNIPALNGHMRLHGGFLKKDPEARKTEKKDPASPPLQTASVSVRALIEEKIIQRRNMAALTPPLDQQLSPQQPQQMQTYFDGSLLSLSPSVDTQQQPQQEEQDNLNDVLDAAAAASALLSDISSLDLQSYIESAQQPGDSSIYTDCLAQYLQSGTAESIFDTCSFPQQPQHHDSINFSFTDTTAAYPQYFQQPQQLYPDDPNSFAEELQLLYNIKEEPDTWNSAAESFQEFPVPEEAPTKAPRTPKTRRSPSKRPRMDELDEILNSTPDLKYSSLLQQQQEVSHYVPAPLLNPRRCGEGLYSMQSQQNASLDTTRDRKARMNIGKDFQCSALPRCKKEKTVCKDPEAAELLWNPLWDSDAVDKYLQWVQHCPAKKVSVEEALNVLHRCQGNVQSAKKILLVENPARKELNWDMKTVNVFAQGLNDYGKNFAKIAQHIPSARAADCLAFYYQWKTVDVEQYQLLKQQWLAQRNSSSSNNKVSVSCDPCEFGSDCTISSSNNNKLEASQQPEPLKTKLYPCSICNKVYDKVKSRSAHMKTHKSANWETRTKNHKAAALKFNLGSTTLSPSTSSSSSSLPSPFLPTY